MRQFVKVINKRKNCTEKITYKVKNRRFVYISFGQAKAADDRTDKHDNIRKWLYINGIVQIIRDIFCENGQKNQTKKHKGVFDKKRTGKKKIITAEKGEKYREKSRQNKQKIKRRPLGIIVGKRRIFY